MDSDYELDEEETQVIETSPDGRFQRYDIVLGRGAFKTVYKGFDTLEGKEIAWNQVNMVHISSDSEYHRLKREIEILQRLKHIHILSLYYAWVDRKRDRVNFITELLSSGTIRHYRLKHKRLDKKVILRWAFQILQALTYLHGHNPPIIHRDLKSDNVFYNGAQGNIKIGDFGLATLLQKNQSHFTTIGTPEFMAPEIQNENPQYNEKVDIYSFGMLLIELLTLKYPYSQCTNYYSIYKLVMTGQPPPELALISDPDLREFVQRCINHNVTERPSAHILLKDRIFADLKGNKKDPFASDSFGSLADLADKGLQDQTTSLPAGAKLYLDKTVANVAAPEQIMYRQVSSNMSTISFIHQDNLANSVQSAHDSDAPNPQSISDPPAQESVATSTVEGVHAVCTRLEDDPRKLQCKLTFGEEYDQMAAEFIYDLDVDNFEILREELERDLELDSTPAAQVTQTIANYIELFQLEHLPDELTCGRESKVTSVQATAVSPSHTQVNVFMRNPFVSDIQTIPEEGEEKSSSKSSTAQSEEANREESQGANVSPQTASGSLASAEEKATAEPSSSLEDSKGVFTLDEDQVLDPISPPSHLPSLSPPINSINSINSIRNTYHSIKRGPHSLLTSSLAHSLSDGTPDHSSSLLKFLEHVRVDSASSDILDYSPIMDNGQRIRRMSLDDMRRPATRRFSLERVSRAQKLAGFWGTGEAAAQRSTIQQLGCAMEEGGEQVGRGCSGEVGGLTAFVGKQNQAQGVRFGR